ncbi:TauD/TfdA dioxygenase family protein [Mycolicibacterium hodleri]|uniref:TauD/TfdA family dioxygenase n=1 Tax=Mycolicibacterium hodleri TaxID=49897 RepID=A0A502E6M4_9MYCO|nr:TauD/TfdA family dioxygenase [Mycolicibacterium hodleri]TPG32482.1 TauD/TfdA family dioxygenase [Mycolicibacterium hodleri]
MTSTSGEYKHFTVSPIADHHPFGAIVSELDPKDLDLPEVGEDLRKLWVREGVLVFDGLDDPDTHVRLSRCFGELIQHPTKEARSQGHPELMDVRYRPEDGWLTEVDGEPRGTWLPWHSDLIYVAEINHGGILRPITIPSHGGETGFIDKIQSYDTLDEDLKESIEGLHVLYGYDLDPADQKFGRRHEVKVLRFERAVLSILARRGDFPTVRHPLVYTQRETGRKVLNLSPWFALGIDEMPGAEGDELLERVAQHCVDPARAYIHEWVPGQMVLWDNWRMLHCANGAPAQEERHMQRTTIEGDYGLGEIAYGEKVGKADYISV